MKIGSILKLHPTYEDAAKLHDSWLWVYEGKEGAIYNFRAVGSGAPGATNVPERTFENWEEEDDPS
jgi:hypothetical protein